MTRDTEENDRVERSAGPVSYTDMQAKICIVILCGLLAGCCSQDRSRTVSQPLAFHPNPDETMSAVVSAINANNQKMPTLWARLYYKADIRDEKRQAHTVFGNGILLYRAPMGMRLVGQKEFVGTVFEIGSTDAEYWLEIKPEMNTLWIGRYADLARLNPDKLPIPIRPDLVLAVLGVGTIDTNFNALPAPTMRYNNEADAYMFVWNAKAPDRWLAEKEVWYDRQTKQPRRVILYDANGRTVLRAELSMPQQVIVKDMPRTQWPTMPGDYKLFFPDTGSRMEFSVSEARLDNGRPPNIHPPDVEGTDVKVVQIGGGGMLSAGGGE